MTDHLVEVPKEGWGDWNQAVIRSRVRFTSQQFQLGEDLIATTQFPTRNRILCVRDMPFSVSITTLYQSPLWYLVGGMEPVHPFLLLALAAGIEGAEDDSIFRHMQYSMAVSPFLLTDANGNNYVFILRNDRTHFFGEFQSLAVNEYFPRCTHIYGYPREREPDHHAPFHTFRLQENGRYGPYVS